jgi:transposase-like protein
MHRQSFLPGFPDGAVKVGKAVSILKKEGRVTHFVGGDNYFSHKEGDEKSWRFVIASLIGNDHVRACDVEASLHIPHRTLMNWMKQYRNEGPESFYRLAPTSRASVMTEEKRLECARLLAEGHSVAEVARQAEVQESTLRKAHKRNAIPLLPGLPDAESEKREVVGSSKSERSREDAEAATNGFGTACTRADERMAAAFGLAQSATTRFEAGIDVQLAGLLVGLPALCANGLLRDIGRFFALPKGFYSVLHILLVLGFMALARIRRPERLRHVPPGEFGKVVGLDRVPEVRTLRQKIALMAKTGTPDAWLRELSKTWMEDDPDAAGYVYVDGHVRVYSGTQANLPRRYVSRQRLCLRGTTDYWVNDVLGRPFFVVSKAVNEGLAECLMKDIVPELLMSIPGQPSQQELDEDPLLHRFVIVFDREGSNYSLLSELWEQRIGALTYRKNVKDVWPETEFTDYEVCTPDGGTTRMKLALRETAVSARKKSMPVIEVRRLTQTGHQTAIITTARRLGTVTIAGRMFARWCQENYFAYMMEHYDIDGLVEYGAEAIPGTIVTVNPQWRTADKAVKTARLTERKLLAKLSTFPNNDPKDPEVQKKAECVEALQTMQTELKEQRAARKALPKKVTLDSLPADQRPTQLAPLNKMLTDAVKMIAYRAETALVTILRKHLQTEDEARALVRELLVSSGDIEPDNVARTLTVRIHRMANPMHDRAVAALLHDLTELQFCHPETGAKMIYALV